MALEERAQADRCGWDVLLQDIRRRLRCDTCGRRNQRLRVGYDQAAVPVDPREQMRRDVRPDYETSATRTKRLAPFDW